MLIYLYISLIAISLSAVVFIIARQIKLLESNQIQSGAPVSFWGSFSKFVNKDALKNGSNFLRVKINNVWQKNRHKTAAIQKIVSRFLNFVWGKHKLENNGTTKYWKEVADHQNNLNKD